MTEHANNQLSDSLLAARGRLLDKVSKGIVGACVESTSTSLAQTLVGPPSRPVAIESQELRKTSPSSTAEKRQGDSATEQLGPCLFAGRYRMITQIGEGGAGRVFRAEHVGTGRLMAVKLLSPEGIEDSVVRARFLAEARVTSSIAHPHVVEMLDAGINDAGQPFVAMELLDGEPLSRMARRIGRLPWPLAREIVLQVADGLGHAHAHGVIHRDIKPENIMVHQLEDGEPVCKIIDFGLAHLKQQLELVDWQSVSGQPIGTAPTMSPEQIKGHEITASSDIYALGCVLFRLLAGRYPFRARTLVEFATAHLYSAPTPLPPLELEPTIRRQIEQVIERCLAKEPKNRFLSMQALSSALRAIDGTEQFDAGHAADPIDVHSSNPRHTRTSRSSRWQTLGLLFAGLAGGTVLASALQNAPPRRAPTEAPRVSQVTPPTRSANHSDTMDTLQLKDPLQRLKRPAKLEQAQSTDKPNQARSTKQTKRRKPSNRTRRRPHPQKLRPTRSFPAKARPNKSKPVAPKVVDELFDPFQ